MEPFSYPIIKFDDTVTISNTGKGKCKYCETGGLSLLKISTSKKKGNIISCDMCKSIILYNRSQMYRTILMKSELTQKEVVQATVKYYKKNGCIPSPNTLDPNSKRLNMSSLQLKFMMWKDPTVKKFVEKKGIVSFFNVEYNLKTIVPRNSFLAHMTKTNDTYWDDVEEMKFYKISNSPILDAIQNDLHDKKVIKIIKASQKSLVNKLKTVKKEYKKKQQEAE